MQQGKRGLSLLPPEKLFVAPPAAVAAPEVDPFPADEATGGTGAVVPPAGNAVALPADVLAPEVDPPSPPMRL